MGAVSLAGTLTDTTGRRTNNVGIAQAIDQIEGKSKQTTIPHGGAVTSIPLDLSTGITDALVLAVYAPTKVVLVLTSSDVTAPGPMRVGLQGWTFLSMTPGEGIAALSVINNDATADVQVDTYVFALAAPTDEPPWWFPTTP